MTSRWLVHSFLFLSGATALVYQLVWSKYLGNLLGNSGQANAIVLATFMGGLAFGAWLFGRTADRVKRPLALYGVLELGIGVYAVLFPWVLDALGAAYLAVAPGTPEGLRAVPRLLLAASSLVLPTILMGGTLPALVRYFADSLGEVRTELSRLYAINSLGAAVGVFLAGVRWVPDFGLLKTSLAAAAINIVLALSAIALGRADPEREDLSSPEDDALAYPARAIKVALWCTLLSGFTSMLLETVWIRILSITLGASTYAFTLILTAFISGIGAGSYWLSRRKKEGDSLLLFGKLQLGLLLLICLSVPLAVRLPWLFWRARALIERSEASWPFYQAIIFGFCCLVLFMPAFLLGAGFPAIARVATAKAKEVGGHIGRAYLWNTGGTVAGSAVGGLVLLPAIGLEWCMALCALSALLAAGLSYWASPERQAMAWNLKALALPALAVLSLVVLPSSSGWGQFLASASTFRESRGAPTSFDQFRDWVTQIKGESLEVLFHEDDTFATVVVERLPSTGHHFVRINGKIDASTGRDMETQIVVGHAGLLFHPGEAKRVLVIGAGSAVTVGSILAHPVEVVDVVEISPSVLEAAHYFKDFNRNALEDPRVRVHVEDAKTFLGLQTEKYDLIVSQPSNPWVVGVSGLFSRDFFKVAKAHLKEDGVLLQWIHSYESDSAVLQLVVRTMRETFPHATGWLGPEDLVLVASPTRQEIDVERISARMARPEVAEDLARVGMERPATLLSRQLMTEEALAAYGGEGIINTDDHNVLEYLAPIAFFVQGFAQFTDERVTPGDKPLAFATMVAEGKVSAADWEAIHKNLSVTYAREDPLVVGAAEAWVAADPQSVPAKLALAKGALAQKNLMRASELVAQAHALDPQSQEVAKVWLEVESRRARGRTLFHPRPSDDEGATRALLAVLQGTPLDEDGRRSLEVVRAVYAKPAESLGLAEP